MKDRSWDVSSRSSSSEGYVRDAQIADIRCKFLVLKTDNISFNLGHTVQAYCRRGYFCWGEISRKCWQDISRGGNFHDSTQISFIQAYRFYFRVGVIFAKKTKGRKTRKLLPCENFHVYSTSGKHKLPT